jgi:hypothetical protein
MVNYYGMDHAEYTISSANVSPVTQAAHKKSFWAECRSALKLGRS